MALRRAARWAQQALPKQLEGSSAGEGCFSGGLSSATAATAAASHSFPSQAYSAAISTIAVAPAIKSLSTAGQAAGRAAGQAAGRLVLSCSVFPGVFTSAASCSRAQWPCAPSLAAARMLSSSSSLMQQQQQQQQAAQPSSTSSATNAAAAAATSTSTPAPTPAPGFTQKVGELLPGLATATGVMLAGSWVADIGGAAFMASQGLTGPSPISGVPVAILLGMLLNNTLSLPKATLAPGLRFCSKAVLQAGIVCVGAKVSFAEVAALGAAGLPVVGAAIASGLASVIWLNSRLGLPPRLGLLTAAGTSICGVTAITALAPAIQANQQEVAYAVANVVAFGLLGLLMYPVLAHHTLDTSEQVGLFLGTAIHDTAQVLGSALMYSQLYQDEVVLKVAAITKLTRNLALVFVIPLLAAINARSAAAATAAAAASAATTGGVFKPPRLPLTTLFPPFILGFLAMAALRSLGDATDGFSGLLSPSSTTSSAQPPSNAGVSAITTPTTTASAANADPSAPSSGQAHDAHAASGEGKARWAAATSFIGSAASGQLLGTAMAAVGLSTSFSVFKGVGMKPFVVGFAGAATVGVTGYTMSRLLGDKLKF